MAGDGRSAAWVNAWQALETARTFREDWMANGRGAVIWDGYWGLIAEANGYIGLASTDTLVGMGGGEWLIDQAEWKKKSAEQKERREHEFAELKKAADAVREAMEHTTRGEGLHDTQVDDE